MLLICILCSFSWVIGGGDSLGPCLSIKLRPGPSNELTDLYLTDRLLEEVKGVSNFFIFKSVSLHLYARQIDWRDLNNYLRNSYGGDEISAEDRAIYNKAVERYYKDLPLYEGYIVHARGCSEVGQFIMRDTPIREWWGFIPPSNIHRLTCAKYHLLEKHSRGNQWTMMKDEEIDWWESNYGEFVEAFASPFNSRTKRFCSLYDTDRPYGSLGRFENLDISTYPRLLISSPSGKMIHNFVAQRLTDYIDNVPSCSRHGDHDPTKFIFVIQFSMVHAAAFKHLYNSKYMCQFRVNDYCYDFLTKNTLICAAMNGDIW